MKSTIATAALALVMSVGFVQSASADIDVQLLAQTRLSDAQDSDVVPVFSCAGRQKERVAAVQLKVKHDPARIDHLKITFGNGQQQNLNVRQYFAQGSTSRWIDLKQSFNGAELRCIRSIKVVGEAVGPAVGRQSVIQVYGVVVD